VVVDAPAAGGRAACHDPLAGPAVEAWPDLKRDLKHGRAA